MFPVLAGLGAAVLAFAFLDDKGETKPKPTPKPSKKSKKPILDVETSAAAHARATKERDDYWKGEVKSMKANHKGALGALKDAIITPSPVEAAPLVDDDKVDDA